MLTGTTTIIDWSIIYDDVSRFKALKKMTTALCQKIEALEEKGIKFIQVDEPALREGLPLNREKWDEYLEEAAYAFRLATATVHPKTQIHTHMCYSNFTDIFD